MIDKVRMNYVRRGIPKKGPFSTEEYNASTEELSVDLTSLVSRWNDQAYPILNSLPRGDDEDRWTGASNVPDPLSDGLDGDNLFVSNDATETSDDGLFWHSTDLRPKTVREVSIDTNDRIDTLQETVSDLTEFSGNDELGYINDFIGKNSGDEETVFTDENYIVSGDSLEAAVDKLDQELVELDTRDPATPGYFRLQDGDSLVLADVLDAGEDNSANTLNGPIVYSRLSGFDGSTWDRVRMGSTTAANSLSVSVATDDTVMGAIETAVEAVQASVEIMDDWDDGADNCNINLAAQSLAAIKVSRNASANAVSNTLWTQISDGTTAVSSSNPLDVELGDGTNQVNVLADIAASQATTLNTLAVAAFAYGYDADGDALERIAVDGDGQLKLANFVAATQSNRVEEVNPISTHFVPEPLATVTGETDGTFTYFIDMNGYKELGLQFIDTTGLYGTNTYTVEGTLQDDGTAPASCVYFDIGNTLYGSANWTADALLLDADRLAGQVKYIKVKVVRASDGGVSDGGWTIYSKKLY